VRLPSVKEHEKQRAKTKQENQADYSRRIKRRLTVVAFIHDLLRYSVARDCRAQAPIVIAGKFTICLHGKDSSFRADEQTTLHAWLENAKVSALDSVRPFVPAK
jgi:hypothetical protein